MQKAWGSHRLTSQQFSPFCLAEAKETRHLCELHVPLLFLKPDATLEAPSCCLRAYYVQSEVVPPG